MAGLQTTTALRRPPSLWGIPPRYAVFDRRKSPPMTVGRFYFDPARDAVVVEVYDDVFREFLKREAPFADRRFEWMLDVAVDAPHDTRAAIVRSDPRPRLADHGEGEPLTLDEAVAGIAATGYYRLVVASDPL